MTKLSLSFLVESDKTFTFFLDGKRQPLLSPLHQGFLLPGSMVMIPSFFKEFGEPPYQRPHCPPHLLYCILSILTPPSSVRLFIKIGPRKFSMFTLSVTCLSRLLSWTPVTFMEKFRSPLLLWWCAAWSLRTDLFSSCAWRFARCSSPRVKAFLPVSPKYSQTLSPHSSQINEYVTPSRRQSPPSSVRQGKHSWRPHLSPDHGFDLRNFCSKVIPDFSTILNFES